MEEQRTIWGGGTLTFRQEGLRVALDAVRPRDESGLYKVWLQGSRGGKLLLGTMAPEGNRLRIRRTLSVGELERAGCWPIEGAKAALAFPFAQEGRWYTERAPEKWVSDPELRAQLVSPMLCKKEEDGVWLAVPFRPDRPLPLTGCFCLAHPERIEGRECLVWRFDRAGNVNL
jgi:hypothetical protein